MPKEEIEKGLRDLEEEEARLRRHLRQLEDVVQAAPGSHRPGTPSAETAATEREIRGVVLRLSDIDRKRQELSVALNISR